MFLIFLIRSTDVAYDFSNKIHQKINKLKMSVPFFEFVSYGI